MNGNSSRRFVLDTNAIIQLLKGNPEVLDLISDSDFLAISVISQLEFLGFAGISREDELLFTAFKERVEVIDVAASNSALMESIANLRAATYLKLPDAIISATAQSVGAVLITADVKLLNSLGDQGVGYNLV